MNSWIKDKRLWTAAAVLALNLLVLGVYHTTLGKAGGARVGVVDMAQVSSETRAQYVQLLMKQKEIKMDTKEAEKAAQAYIDKTSNVIDNEIRAIERDCGCLLLMRGVAVGGTGVLDYTQRLIKAIGANT
jgi:hypothetical protein